MAFARSPQKDQRMNKYQLYTQLKQEWLRANPGATSEQIERACQRIAKKAGL